MGQIPMASATHRGGKGLKSHSIIPFPEMNVLTVPLQRSGSVGRDGGAPTGELYQAALRVSDLGWPAGKKGQRLIGDGWPCQEDETGGRLGNEAESQVLRNVRVGEVRGAADRLKKEARELLAGPSRSLTQRPKSNLGACGENSYRHVKGHSGIKTDKQ